MSIGRVPGATGIQPSIVTAKGDLIVATASGSVTNQAVGSNNQVLMADSAQADGVKWANEATATLTTTGDLLYASAANTPARLAIGSTDQVLKVSGGIPAWGAAPAASFVGCRLTKSAVQSISNATDTNITWDTEAYDTDGFHSTTTNTSRITIPSGKAGKYLFHSMTIFGNNATGYRSSDFIKNGTTNITGGWFQSNLAANGYNGGTAITVADLAVGDYVELRVYQNSGGNLNFASGSDTVFGCVYLGA